MAMSMTHRFSLTFLALFLALVVPGEAFAEELLVLVTEKVTEQQGDTSTGFWWAEANGAAWTDTDDALAAALASEGAAMVRDADLSRLSRIYRRPEPTDSNAAAMASVLGPEKVLVGTAEYAPTSLRPVGLAGVRVTLRLRLLERTSGGARILGEVEVDRRSWSADVAEARRTASRQAATAAARIVSGSLEQRSGPVGLATSETLIGIEQPESKRVVDAVRAKLKTLAGVTEVRERWASEGFIALEVNPGQADAADSVRQWTTLLVAEGTTDYTIEPADSGWPSVIAIRARAAAEEPTP